MDGFIVWKTDHLEPADDRTKAYLEKRSGEILSVVILSDKKSRDLVRHNQFHAIIDRCVDSMDYVIHYAADREQAAEDLIIKLKYATGFVRGTIGLDGKYRDVPRSLDFMNCSEEDAEQFRVKAYAVLCQILNCSRQELFGF